MANSFGSLYIGSSSLRNSQNALNTTANNLTNVDTTGYVRQQVLFSDTSYISFATASVSTQQYGLGVTIGDVVHTRDMFLDKSFRNTAAREAFYTSSYEATYEVQTYFQEMEGTQFQEALNDFWTAFNDFGENPGDTTAQNMIIQKASLFVSRSQAIYSGLQTYQKNINTQISDKIDSVNKLANSIYDLNSQIQKIEAGGVETAMDLRDARDQALDDLSALGKISYSEDSNGIVSVKFEDHELVDEGKVYEMGKQVDKVTDFITPYWPNSSDTSKDDYDYVYDFSVDISSELNTDMGSLKALVLARGDEVTNYYDLFHNADGSTMTSEQYQDSIGMSVMENTEAEFDQLVHSIITTINDLFCPNTAQSTTDGNYYDADGTLLYKVDSATTPGTSYLCETDGNAYYDADGNKITVASGTKFLDTNTSPVGADGKLPPEELFTRSGCERYTQVDVYDNLGNKTGSVWTYNEENVNDTSTMYTTASVSVNADLLKTQTQLPHLTQNGSVDQALGEALVAAWSSKSITLSPYDTEPCTFQGFYEKMVNEVATAGNIYSTTSDTMSSAVLYINNQRQQVIGVSTDEELTNMIKYQNAYNAASRYINVITTMIDTIINSMQ